MLPAITFTICTDEPTLTAAAEARMAVLAPEMEAWLTEPSGGIRPELQVAALQRRWAEQERLDRALIEVIDMGACGPILSAVVARASLLEGQDAWLWGLPAEGWYRPYDPSCGHNIQRVIEISGWALRRAHQQGRWADPAAVEAWRRLQALDPARYPLQYEVLAGGPFFSGWAEGSVTFLE